MLAWKKSRGGGGGGDYRYGHPHILEPIAACTSAALIYTLPHTRTKVSVKTTEEIDLARVGNCLHLAPWI